MWNKHLCGVSRDFLVSLVELSSETLSALEEAHGEGLAS